VKQIHFRGVVALLAVLALLSGCGGARDDQVTVADKKEVQGEGTTEAFRVDNKDGTEALVQELQAQRQYTHEVIITPKPGARLNNEQVRQEVFKLYNIPADKVTDNQVCLIPVDVPPGQVYLYDIEWRDVWREGVIEVGEPNDEPEGDYRFKQGPLCQVVGVRPE